MLIYFDHAIINDCRRAVQKYAAMMSPYFSPERNASAIPREIIAIHEEITQIDVHRTEHMIGYGKVKQLDQSCKYCQVYFQSEVTQAASPAEPAAPEIRPQGKSDDCNCKPAAKQHNLERTVDLAGKKGQIVVPRSWAGKRVRVTLL